MLHLTGLVLAASMVGQASEPENHDKLKETLGWVIGSWEGQIGDLRPTATYEWIINEQFIRGRVTAKGQDGKHTEMLNVLFGWDPVQKTFKVWGFSSEGSNSVGTFAKAEGHEIFFKITYSHPEGPGSFTLVYAHPNENTLVVEYRDHRRGGEALDDLEAVLKRN